MFNAEKGIRPAKEVDSEFSREMKQANSVFEEHRETILATIYSYINNKSDVDDIFQEFFLSLVRRPIPANIENVKGYLRRAIKNDIIDAAKKAKKHRMRDRVYTERHLNRVQITDPEDIATLTEETRRLFGIIAQTVTALHRSITKATAA